MGDLPKEKVVVPLWWVTYPEKMLVSLWWVTYPMVSLWWVTYPDENWWSHCDGWPTQIKWWSHSDGWPTQIKWWSHSDGWPTQMQYDDFFKKWSHCYGWPTPMECDLPGKKTWQAKSWQDKADKRRFLIVGLTWLLLMTWLISSFLWDFPTGRVHLIPFSFQDLNWFFVIIDSMILSIHNLAGLHWGFSCNKSTIYAMLWG